MVREVYLVGVGLGNVDTLTVQARTIINRSDLLIGAKRLVQPFQDLPCEKLHLIRSSEIEQALRASDAACASVLFSGDVGFYSGATALAEKLSDFTVKAVPGISSLVYFCAQLLTPWQDAHLVSAHGRECNVVDEVSAHAKTFLLTGGNTKAHDICAQLDKAGLGEVTVSVGERLSYDDERICTGTAHDLSQQEFCDLAVMLVRNPKGKAQVPGALEDCAAVKNNA